MNSKFKTGDIVEYKDEAWVIYGTVGGGDTKDPSSYKTHGYYLGKEDIADMRVCLAEEEFLTKK